MLVLSRKCDSEIQIGPDIIIKVLEIHKRQVKLGIEAPIAFSVRRGDCPPSANRGRPRTYWSQSSCSATSHGQPS